MSIMRWADVVGVGRGAEGTIEKSRLVAKSCPHVESWVIGLGEDLIQPADSFCFQIERSRLNLGDAMLCGVVDAACTGARESRHAKAIYYYPRAGQCWVMHHSRVVKYFQMPSDFVLYERAVGTEVQVRLLESGQVAFRVDGAGEFVVPSVEMPPTVRPSVRLGKPDDVVSLHKSRAGRAERASSDSVIAELV